MSSREIFSSGDNGVSGSRACLLIPDGTFSVRKHCGGVGESLKSITTGLFQDVKDLTQPPGYAMLFSTNKPAALKDDPDGKFYYFNFPDMEKSTSKITIGGKPLRLLDVLKEKANNDQWSSETRDVDTDPTDILANFIEFIHKYRYPIGTMLTLAGIVALLISSEDDPKSFIPKKTQKWLSTTSPAKKIVDVGSFWHRNFGEGYRPHDNIYNRPDYQNDRRQDQPWQRSFQDRVPQMIHQNFNNFAIPFKDEDDGFESLNFR
jgi:hypothetical protein